MTSQVTEVGDAVSPTSKDVSMYIDLPHLLTEDDGAWRDHAYCKGHRELLPLFFTENATRIRTRAVMVAEAQEICAKCTVRKECFNFAKSNDMGHGVWGGVDFFIPKTGRKDRHIPDDIN